MQLFFKKVRLIENILHVKAFIFFWEQNFVVRKYVVRLTMVRLIEG